MLKFQFFVIFIVGLQGSRGFINLHNPIVFYDLKNKEPLTPPITKILPDSENESFNMSSVINIRLPFIGQPCKSLHFQVVIKLIAKNSISVLQADVSHLIVAVALG